MSIRLIERQLAIQAAKGRLNEDLIPRLTIDFVLEAAVQAYHGGYFGAKVWNECADKARSFDHAAKEAMMVRFENTLTDITRIRKVHKETHSTSDFPLTLGLARDYVRNPTFSPIESDLLTNARKRTVNDFKRIRTIRGSGFDKLVRRSELMNIEYTTFGSTDDGFNIGNYSLALAFSWEAYINDDLGEFTQAANELGLAGRRTRQWVAIDSIKALTPATLTAGVGGPDVARITELDKLFAAKTTVVTGEGGVQKTLPRPRVMTDILIPPRWRQEANTTLSSEKLIVSGGGTTQRTLAERNPAYGLAIPTLDAMLDEAGTPGDWVALAGKTGWMTLATLAGYEAGPKAFTKRPDVVETLDQGSFDNKSMAIKVDDNFGVNIDDKDAVILVKGS